MLNNTRAPVGPSRAAEAVATRPRSACRWAGVVTGVLLAVSLTACGSRVRLNEATLVAAAPEKDRNCNDMLALQQGAPGAGGSAVQRAVASVDVEGTDVPQPAGMVRVVYFDFDSYLVRDEFAAILEANAQYLAANSSRMVRLEGHADERGGREYNLALGQRRSEAVRRMLSVLGVKESQMEAVSYGEERPAVVGFDEAAYAKNRRVELIYR
jgi:peptidoglycan-associated lipoprotein